MSGIRLLYGIDRKRPDRVDAEFVDVIKQAARLVCRLEGLTHLTSAFDNRGGFVAATASFVGGPRRQRGATISPVVAGSISSAENLF
jgi:hypothetical protein